MPVAANRRRGRTTFVSSFNDRVRRDTCSQSPRPSSSDDGRVVIWRPGPLERSDRDLLIPATEDATVIEVHYPCSGVYAGDDDEVVRGASVAGPIPDGFGVDYHDDPASFGQVTLQLVDACLNVVGLDSV